MKHKITVVLTLAALAIASSLAFGQKNHHQPPDPATMAQHRVHFLTERLGLDAQQQQQATTIFTNAANGHATIRNNMKTAHDSLQTAINNNDAAGIDQAANTIGTLTSQMVSTESKANAAFFQILHPDQQGKFKELEERGPGPFGRGHWRGHRGPGGPPPAPANQ